MAKKDEQKAEAEEREVATSTTTATPAEIADAFPMDSAAEGVDVRFPIIEIIHPAQQFKMPEGIMAPIFTGVILDIYKANAYWKESFDETGGGSPPDCFSMDSVTPDMSATDRQADRCHGCPWNEFGSDGGRGKACKNMQRMHVMIEGNFLPHAITIPPSSIGSVSQGISNFSINKGIPYQLMQFTFTLKEASNKEGIKYSQVECSAVMDGNEPAVNNTPEYLADIKGLHTRWLPVMRGWDIGAEFSETHTEE